MNRELAKITGMSIIRIKSYIDDLFTQHPADESMTYIQHFLKTMKLSMWMGVGSVRLLIHAYFPFMCKKTEEYIISNLNNDIHLKM